MTATDSKATETGKALTANRLDDGIVIFMTRSGTWSPAINDAAVALEARSQSALDKRAVAAVANNEAADAYLIDVERAGGQVRALHIRERIRTLGPTVRPDLGKQANGAGGNFAAAS